MPTVTKKRPTQRPTQRKQVERVKARPGVGRERFAFVCQKCDPPMRVFLQPGDIIPECETHGPMQRQENHSYMGEST